mmetsp:Transcript_124009/g.358628  ORF Transcript_124009/g.358628 Transcript_124009/m.358628 type:complete len:217 (-) Transcript_124009:399-1049(-)
MRSPTISGKSPPTTQPMSGVMPLGSSVFGSAPRRINCLHVSLAPSSAAARRRQYPQSVVLAFGSHGAPSRNKRLASSQFSPSMAPTSAAVATGMSLSSPSTSAARAEEAEADAETPSAAPGDGTAVRQASLSPASGGTLAATGDQSAASSPITSDVPWPLGASMASGTAEAGPAEWGSSAAATRKSVSAATAKHASTGCGSNSAGNKASADGSDWT